MSAFMMNPDRIATLAEYIAAVHDMGFNYFGYSIPESLHYALLDCRDDYGYMITEKIYDRLSDLNMRAVCGRYKHEPFIYDKMPKHKHLHQYRERGKDEMIDRWYADIQAWHYELLKLTQCFLYQCNEDDTDNDPIFLGLRELETAQMHHIIENNPMYIKAAWG